MRAIVGCFATDEFLNFVFVFCFYSNFHCHFVCMLTKKEQFFCFVFWLLMENKKSNDFLIF